MTNLLHCACCQPPRQIYLRANGKVDTAYHEKDHMPAARPETLRAQKPPRPAPRPRARRPDNSTPQTK